MLSTKTFDNGQPTWWFLFVEDISYENVKTCYLFLFVSVWTDLHVTTMLWFCSFQTLTEFPLSVFIRFSTRRLDIKRFVAFKDVAFSARDRGARKTQVKRNYFILQRFIRFPELADLHPAPQWCIEAMAKCTFKPGFYFN